MIKRIDGFMLEKMLKNGLANLRLHEKEINDLNVFPVPDGDTGTNMCKTLESGASKIQSNADTSVVLKAISVGMLLGARGNSGVILSQFFKGFYTELRNKPVIGIGELRNGLIMGYRNAYKTVLRPVEGTMLTVAREGIENIRGQISRLTPCDVLISMYIAEMKKILSQTPDMLDVLKEAGVVDSGAAGFILIFEGMLKSLYGEHIEDTALDFSVKEESKKIEVTPEIFNENSAFEDGYCMEFILQLMKTGEFDQNFKMKSFTGVLESYGNSVVAVQDNMLVKVHVHTKNPSKIIRTCEEYGVFIDFKLENMQVQHNEKKAKVKDFARIAVSNGEGFTELFESFGCDAVLDGGATMNTSSKEFVDAFKKVNAKKIVVLPNNSNVILAAKQAAEIYKEAEITVLSTKTLAEGYFALAMDMADSDDFARRIKQMENGATSTLTLQETTASRAYSVNELSCKEGDEICLLGGELICVKNNMTDCIRSGLTLVPDMDEKEMCIVFRGKDADEDAEDDVREIIEESWPGMEVEFVYGGQEIYHWIIGIS